MVGDEVSEYRFTIPGQPVPCPRPRVTRRGVFYSDRYKDWVTAVQVAVVEAGGATLLSDGPWACHIRLYGAHKWSDVDNIAKGILDSLTGFLWPSDNLKHLQDLRVVWFPVINSRDARTEIECKLLT